MLQGIARRTLKSHDVLINAGLREDVLVEEVVIAETATQGVVVPGRFPLDPRLFGYNQAQRLFLPLCARVAKCGRPALAVLAYQRVNIEAGSQVAVQKSEGFVFTGLLR